MWRVPWSHLNFNRYTLAMKLRMNNGGTKVEAGRSVRKLIHMREDYKSECEEKWSKSRYTFNTELKGLTGERCEM